MKLCRFPEQNMKLLRCAIILLIHDMIGLTSGGSVLELHSLGSQYKLTFNYLTQESSTPKRHHKHDASNEAEAANFTKRTPPPHVYAGAQVWRTALERRRHRVLIDRLIEKGDISIWRLNQDVADYLVLEPKKVKVNRQLEEVGLDHTVLILDVQRRIQGSRAVQQEWTEHALRFGHRLNFESYPSNGVIEEYMDFLEKNYGSIATIKTIGTSVETRPIKMVTISNGNPTNKGILVTAGMHAREWAGISSAMYMMHQLVTEFDEQPMYVRNKDWHIIPVVNPDGYEYTQHFDRLWRKTRVASNTSDCRGVDINRNFDIHWVREVNECHEVFSGKVPFSEPETMALRDAVLNLTRKPHAFIDLHAYGQIILYPWSSGLVEAKNKDVLRSVCNGMSEIMKNVTNNQYKVGTAPELISPTRGAALDWIYGSGIPLAYAIESPGHHHGFLMPEKLIRVTGQEMFGAVKHVARKLDDSFTLGDGEFNAWL